MASNELRVALEVETGFGLQHTNGCKRDRHQRRLGIFGEREGFLRAFENDSRELGAQRVVHLGEHLPGRREIRGQRFAHAHGLAALTRKYECDRHVMSLLPRPLVEIGPKDTATGVCVKLSLSKSNLASNQAKRLCG